MNQQLHQLSPKDWQLLSEYLDGQLSQRDQSHLEQRLQQQNELRLALEELRQTRAMLRSVRMQRVPRNFTLTPAMVEKIRPRPIFRLVPVLNFASALATLAVIIALAVQFLPGTAPAAALPSPDAALPAAAAPSLSQNPTPTSSGEPVILQWNSPNSTGNQEYATGRGGAGAGAVPSDLSNAAPPINVPGFTIPQGTGSPESQQKALGAAAVTATPVPGLGAEAVPTAEAAGTGPNLSPAPTAEAPLAPQTILPGQPQATESVAQAPLLEGSGPILGVKPKQEADTENQTVLQEQARQLQPERAAAIQQQPRQIEWVVPALLGLIALATALAALVIRRKAGS